MRHMLIAAAIALLAGCPDDGGRPLGATCDDGAQCQSGLCVERVCVDPAALTDTSDDATAEADTVADTQSVDDTVADTQVAPDTVADTATDTGAAPDTVASTAVVCEPAPLDAIVVGTFPQPGGVSGPITFLPGGAAAVNVDPVEPEAGRVAAYVARTTQSGGLAWVAQAVATDTTLNVLAAAIAHDPVTDAVYVGWTTTRGTAPIRFYHADGTLFREHTPAGAPGSDVRGGNGQRNLFVARYAAAGTLTWLHRFGPNDAAGTRGATIDTLQSVGNRVRATGTISELTPGDDGPGQLVFGVGEDDALTVTRDTGFVYALDFDSATGDTDTAGLLTVEVDGLVTSGPAGSSGLTNADGQRVFASYHRGPTVGDVAIGDFSITPESRSSWLIRHDPGDATWGRFAYRVDEGPSPRPQALALAPDGSPAVSLWGAGSSTDEVTFAVYASDGPLLLDLGPSRAFLVRYYANGEAAWLAPIDSRGADAYPYALTYDEASAALYAVGSASTVTTLTPAGGTPQTLAGGRYLARFAWAHGALIWFAHVAPDPDFVFLGAPHLRPSGIHVPVRFTAAVAVDASGVRDLVTPTGAEAWGELVYDTDGAWLGCATLVDFARGLTLTEPPVAD